MFILGDLFEVWVGDDARRPAASSTRCADVLREPPAQRTVGFMAGNRDFLVGAAMLRDCGVRRAARPHRAATPWASACC